MFVFLGPRPFAWPMALALSPCFSPGLWPRTPALVPSLHLLTLASNFYLPALTLDFCLPILAPNLYLPALVYNSVTSLVPEFLIYQPCFLNLCLCLRPWTTICITGLGPEFAFTLLLVVVAVVVVIAVVVISLELMIPLFVRQF